MQNCYIVEEKSDGNLEFWGKRLYTAQKSIFSKAPLTNFQSLLMPASDINQAYEIVVTEICCI